MAGSAARWAERAGLAALAALALAVPPAAAASDTLYKYRGDDGEWVYTDRRPAAAEEVEVRPLASAADEGVVIHRRETETGFEVVAENRRWVAVELVLAAMDLENLAAEDERGVRTVVPARTGAVVLGLERLDPALPGRFRFRYQTLPGDPGASHDPEFVYRFPFAPATRHRVTQAWPDVSTHDSLASRHAVDVAVPVGTGVYAARAGTVFEVAGRHFRGGTDRERDLPRANLVRIVHDDGTMAVYAHLNWDSIRVRPGQKVARGEYIADSGNTGYTTGPHLHFAVQRNAGLRLESVPVRFAAPDGAVTPRTGMEITAF